MTSSNAPVTDYVGLLRCLTKNIKDRLNRKVVLSTLNKIRERLLLAPNPNGLIVFAGVDEFNQDVLELVDLSHGVKLDVFHYDCSNKFDTDFALKYVKSYDGSIIFANGNECMIYTFDGKFRRVKHINACLIKRQRKGGQSALRISRLAEESRHIYVVHVVDTLNSLQTRNNWLFGSEEIVGMILSNKTLLTPVQHGGFLDFNSSTINDQRRFLEYLKPSNESACRDQLLSSIVLYLDTNPDMLDFELSRRHEMRSYLTRHPTDEDLQSSKYLALDVGSKHYARLHMFEYVGLKYFACDLDEEVPDECLLRKECDFVEKEYSLGSILDPVKPAQNQKKCL